MRTILCSWSLSTRALRLHRLIRNALAALAPVAIVAAAASPAKADVLGTVVLSSEGGTVNDNPMFASARASAACPAGYGENGALRVGLAATPYEQHKNLAAALGGGGWDVTVPSWPFDGAMGSPPNRSFAQALAGIGNPPIAPTDGEWWITVACYSLTLGLYEDMFVTPIYVTGSNWSVNPPPPPLPEAGADDAGVVDSGDPDDGGVIPDSGEEVTADVHIDPVAREDASEPSSPPSSGGNGGGAIDGGGCAVAGGGLSLAYLAFPAAILALVRRRQRKRGTRVGDAP